MVRNPLPTADDLDALYEAAWTDPQDHRAETGGTDPRLAEIYVRRLTGELGRRTLEGLRIVDFGAGRGELASALRDAQAEVAVVDPYSFESLAALGFESYAGVDAIPQDVWFDGVVTMDVVEHLETPWDHLRALREHIRPQGWAFVSTVNPYGLNALLRRDGWRELQKPGHIIFFGPRAAEVLLERSGFVEPRRLHWFVGYKPGPASAIERALVTGRLEGALRYIAFRRDPPAAR